MFTTVFIKQLIAELKKMSASQRLFFLIALLKQLELLASETIKLAHQAGLLHLQTTNARTAHSDAARLLRQVNRTQRINKQLEADLKSLILKLDLPSRRGERVGVKPGRPRTRGIL